MSPLNCQQIVHSINKNLHKNNSNFSVSLIFSIYRHRVILFKLNFNKGIL